MFRSGICTTLLLQTYLEYYHSTIASCYVQRRQKLQSPTSQSSIHDSQLILRKNFTDINARITFRFEIFVTPSAPSMMHAEPLNSWQSEASTVTAAPLPAAVYAQTNALESIMKNRPYVCDRVYLC